MANVKLAIKFFSPFFHSEILTIILPCVSQGSTKTNTGAQLVVLVVKFEVWSDFKMKFKVIKLIKEKTERFEGIAMLDENEKEYITNGITILEALPHRKAKWRIVESIDKERFLGYWNKHFPHDELEFFTEIKTTEQFHEIRNTQNATEISTRKELTEVVSKLQNKNKSYTIFSLQDEWYITYGVRWANNIGFYVLEGNFTLPNDIDAQLLDEIVMMFI